MTEILSGYAAIISLQVFAGRNIFRAKYPDDERNYSRCERRAWYNIKLRRVVYYPDRIILPKTPASSICQGFSGIKTWLTAALHDAKFLPESPTLHLFADALAHCAVDFTPQIAFNAKGRLIASGLLDQHVGECAMSHYIHSKRNYYFMLIFVEFLWTYRGDSFRWCMIFSVGKHCLPCVRRRLMRR